MENYSVWWYAAPQFNFLYRLPPLVLNFEEPNYITTLELHTIRKFTIDGGTKWALSNDILHYSHIYLPSLIPPCQLPAHLCSISLSQANPVKHTFAGPVLLCSRPHSKTWPSSLSQCSSVEFYSFSNRITSPRSCAWPRVFTPPLVAKRACLIIWQVESQRRMPTSSLLEDPQI
jgi:hypothetical protein